MEYSIAQLQELFGQLKERAELPAKIEKIKELTLFSGESGFWNDRENARKTLEELSRLKTQVEEIETLELELLLLQEKQGGSEGARERLMSRLREVELKTLLSGEIDSPGALINFFSGAGGDDAQDWTTMLLGMYNKYCLKKGWEAELLHQSFGELGGTKEATLEITGRYIYGFLKKESGVHRLIRISPFSAKKLRHTSFALVEVLPIIREVDKKDITIDPKDLRIDLYRSSGPGGQNVNRRETAVRITHIPTGIWAASQSQRSQLQNREKAFEILFAKLHQLLREKHKDTLSSFQEKVSIEWGHQIRSYTLDPYTLVKDHRTGVETADVQEVLEGNLDKFIEGEIHLL